MQITPFTRILAEEETMDERKTIGDICMILERIERRLADFSERIRRMELRLGTVNDSGRKRHPRDEPDET